MPETNVHDEAVGTRLRTILVSARIQIHQALDFMRATLHEPTLNLNRTAKAVRMSPFHLTRVFKRDTGFGFSHHLRSIRVSEAERLLRTTTLSVKEVAASVGYSNTNALERNFRTVLSITPTEYRRLVTEPREVVIAENSLKVAASK